MRSSLARHRPSPYGEKARGPGDHESPRVPLAISRPERKTPATQRPRTLSGATDARRGTGPRPTVKRRGGPAITNRRGFPPRSFNDTKTGPFTVARGPLRRNVVISAASLQRCPLSLAISRPERKTPAAPRPRTLSDAIGAWRGTGPRPTVKRRGGPAITNRRGFPSRSFNDTKTGPFTVARGPLRRNVVISAASLQRCPLSLAISRPERKTPAAPRPRTLSDAIDAWRGTGPRPTVKRRECPAIANRRGFPSRSLNDTKNARNPAAANAF